VGGKVNAFGTVGGPRRKTKGLRGLSRDWRKGILTEKEPPNKAQFKKGDQMTRHQNNSLLEPLAGGEIFLEKVSDVSQMCDYQAAERKLGLKWGNGKEGTKEKQFVCRKGEKRSPTASSTHRHCATKGRGKKVRYGPRYGGYI